MTAIELVEASGRTRAIGADEFLELVRPLCDDVLPPFDARALEVLSGVSRRLLRGAAARKEPQLAALAYWLRPAALERLARRHDRAGGERVRVARGLAYQLPPQNVDTLFVYSWALSFLVGNANVTRLPTADGPTLRRLVDVLASELDARGQAHRQLFCRFDHGGPVGRELSALADLRVVWGGDAKIRAVSVDPVRPDGLSLAFPDRRSMCLIDADAYEALDAAARDALAHGLHNDVFWFDQMGCASPHAIVWLVGNSPPAHDLLERMDEVARARGRGTDAAVGISKLVFANQAVCAGRATGARRLSAATTVVLADAASGLLDAVHGGGLLYEVRVARIEDVRPLLRRDLQTVTAFGVDRDQLVSLARLGGGAGPYRIVPIGEALQFDATWDGLDLVEHFSRLVTVRGAAPKARAESRVVPES